MPQSNATILATSSVIVVNPDGNVLLQRRSDNGLWCLPGGAMEIGESFEETARREVYEETGLKVRELSVFMLHSGKQTYHVYPDGNQVYMASAVFVTHHFTGTLRTNSEESLDVNWFSPDALPEISPNQRPIVNAFLEARRTGQPCPGCIQLERQMKPGHWFSWRGFVIGFAIVWIGVLLLAIVIGYVRQRFG